jgi:hypothetical protein
MSKPHAEAEELAVLTSRSTNSFSSNERRIYDSKHSNGFPGIPGREKSVLVNEIRNVGIQNSTPPRSQLESISTD